MFRKCILVFPATASALRLSQSDIHTSVYTVNVTFTLILETRWRAGWIVAIPFATEASQPRKVVSALQEVSDCYAPVVVTTNKDVTAIPVDISKRMLACHIDAAIPENKSVAGQVARKITREIGTALYREYLLRMLPKVQSMRAAIDEGQPEFPDLLT